MLEPSLELFHKAASQVPAYADFLKQHSIKPAEIKTVDDFKSVPLTSKKNYLQKYPLNQLVWGGDIMKPLIFCSTSGSTGLPYYFPRDEELSEQYSVLIEKFLSVRPANNQPTLVIIAFGMGVWIGGIITLKAFEMAIARMNYPASLLPTGYNKAEVIKALHQLAPQFGQTVLVGYPPFIKEIIDEAEHQAIDLTKLKPRLLFAAEAFSETFRDYVCQKTGADPVLDTLNIYGTADIGAMAYETPLSILIRRLAIKQPDLFNEIFGQIEKTPTLAQFNPDFVEFEAVDGEVLLTGNSALPLIRYAVGDHGGVIDYTKLEQILHKHGLNMGKEAFAAGFDAKDYRQPFVFVYERSNFAVSLHGIVIYPEYIREALLDANLAANLSERFTMLTKSDKDHNQYLEINIELQNGVKESDKLAAQTKELIRQKLIEKSSEFKEISKDDDSSRLLKLKFWPYGDPKYFSPGVKQQWSIKSD